MAGIGVGSLPKKKKPRREGQRWCEVWERPNHSPRRGCIPRHARAPNQQPPAATQPLRLALPGSSSPPASPVAQLCLASVWLWTAIVPALRSLAIPLVAHPMIFGPPGSLSSSTEARTFHPRLLSSILSTPPGDLLDDDPVVHGLSPSFALLFLTSSSTRPSR